MGQFHLPQHNITTGLPDRLFLKPPKVPPHLPSLMPSDQLRNKLLLEADHPLPLLVEMPSIMELIPEDMAHLDGILITPTMTELDIVVVKPRSFFTILLVLIVTLYTIFYFLFLL